MSDKGSLRENPLRSAASGKVGRLALLAAPLAVLLAAAVLVAPALAVNLGRVRVLQAVDVAASIQGRAAAGWRSGWAGVCEGGLLAGWLRAGATEGVWRDFLSEQMQWSRVWALVALGTIVS